MAITDNMSEKRTVILTLGKATFISKWKTRLVNTLSFFKIDSWWTFLALLLSMFDWIFYSQFFG